MDTMRTPEEIAIAALEQIASADHPDYPHFKSGTEWQFSDHLMEVARAALAMAGRQAAQ